MAGQRCVAGRTAPHELQKRALAAWGFPQALQKKLAPAAGCGGGADGCAGAAACLCGSEETAQISATIQPMKVQPRKRFTSSIAVKLDLFRARTAGRKYSSKDTSMKKGWKWKKGMNHKEEISMEHAPPDS
jgi:hypothetical protein